MNSPDPEIGGLIDGSHIFWVTRMSDHVVPPSSDRERYVSMKKLSGSFRRSKYMMFTCPEAVIAICGWNWSLPLPILSWSTARVNQDKIGNGKDQFQPQIV